MWIAGTKTEQHWAVLSQQLQTHPTDALWQTAFDEFFMVRIQTRYLNPIAAIESLEKEDGEGFSIVALFCTLIEFLETCEQGHNFRKGADRNLTAQTFEYGLSQGRGYFEHFLKTKEPFKTIFPEALVSSFYADVRCGLLHEARTQGGWVISTRLSDGHLVRKVGNKVRLYRNELKPAFDIYFADYRARLLADVTGDLKRAFVRKFDHLAVP